MRYASVFFSLSIATLVALVHETPILPTSGQDDPDLYEKAKQLYEQGPMQTRSCVGLLEQQIKNKPSHESAIALLTQIKIHNAQFAAGKKLAETGQSQVRRYHRISPQLYFLAARCRYELGEIESARKDLEMCKGFFNSDADKMWQFSSPTRPPTRTPM